ncbi:MAG: stage III sporulation protein AE [Clostridia bacterium]|nr:stage III sporulation protein AE [Clostridia bacterium]
MRRLTRLWIISSFLLLLFPFAAHAESLSDAMKDTLNTLPLQEWQAAYDQAFPQGEDFQTLLLRLARGDMRLDAESLLRSIASRFLNALTASAWRLARLLIPAVFCGVMQRLKASFSKDALGETLSAACFLLLAGSMAQDLGQHLLLARDTVARMADLMQALFPVLLTLLAAVGGTAGAAFFQPAVVAASGTMTALVRSVTLPLALAAGVTTILNHLSPRMRISRLSSLFHSGASWTLGVGFTVFISVTALQSLGAAAADGVSIRTAKYAVDHFVPVVGGMFADTMDTLVGASLLIKNALGLTGLLLLLSVAAVPMLQTLAAAMLYRAGAAVLEPLSDARSSACLQDFSEVLMLLFVIQLSVGAMFLLLVAQMLVVGNLTVMLR